MKNKILLLKKKSFFHLMASFLLSSLLSYNLIFLKKKTKTQNYIYYHGLIFKLITIVVEDPVIIPDGYTVVRYPWKLLLLTNSEAAIRVPLCLPRVSHLSETKCSDATLSLSWLTWASSNDWEVLAKKSGLLAKKLFFILLYESRIT